ncbi:MAG: DUF6600 domain-containing protein, partial [Sphingomonadaceae bacterium]
MIRSAFSRSILVGCALLAGACATYPTASPAVAQGSVAVAAHWGYPGAARWWGSPAPSLSVFVTHLEPYGMWQQHPGFGAIWVPRVGPGWQPYSIGRWVHDPRFGRRWSSGEPFGWIAFHYGRWGFDPRLGWFWVPDLAFGPHWVDFRSGGGYWGWAPLPPRAWDRWGRYPFLHTGWGWNYPGWVFVPHGALWNHWYRPPPRPVHFSRAHRS